TRRRTRGCPADFWSRCKHARVVHVRLYGRRGARPWRGGWPGELPSEAVHADNTRQEGARGSRRLDAYLFRQIRKKQDHCSCKELSALPQDIGNHSDNRAAHLHDPTMRFQQIAVLTTAFLGACATAHPDGPLSADRPGFVDLTSTVAPGLVQTEAGYTQTHL